MKKLSLIISICMLASMLLAGCQGTTAPASSSAAPSSSEAAPAASSAPDAASSSAVAVDGPYNITLILKNLTNPFWVRVKEGAEQAAADLGVNLTVLAPTVPDSNEEQIAEVEQSIAKKEHAICIAPADSAGIVPAIEKANAANMPIFNVNTMIQGDVRYETFVVAENFDVACAVGDKLVEKMGGSGKIIILEGKMGAQSAQDLKKGADATFAKYADIEVVASQTAQWSRSEALTVTQNLLQAHPDVNAIFACNDEMAMGALEAVNQAGKTGQIMITGVDANDDAILAVKEGTLTMTCDKDAEGQGYEVVRAAVEYLKGNAIDEFITVAPTLIDTDNVDAYMEKRGLSA